ncbi:DUF1638 domain-containing protein [Phaeobacter gallaeciensis]|uniref:DUF1638 domain-containing protein n=1 Tax=Phaeobacter gallaeciensis TaxID=60890 RepID=A0AAC9Z9I3_9RHOB|nr:DUF1638 domain-containing protein [Phaeobacter gallaeciensis]AHD09820.1 hypothetical protein Gal_02070 [Phaeobacter gallaeciensis DSM 26640]ATE93084.1 hypothetical protein PhaeoP11_02061 [Phaeobacter gallaeciensis]ATE97094.1 hypothetical protein PhaeoP73_01785 [Phaeobacter gallaeciensis]ATF01749.1 hypothetical protein PhaeoP75_02111 [Phaeobacter gallaeciensis]ATF06129.1 hypothetical protein PhaeoP63_02060 [Phaeobacter gallaeciensis]
MARKGRAARLTERAAFQPPTGRTLEETSLTERGLAAPEKKTGRILLIACGALAREILAIKDINRLDHIDLTCLPAKLHLYPEQITEAVEGAVAKHSATYDTIHVVYADCGTGGILERKCAELGVEMIAGPHCYSFFEGNETFARHTDGGEITAFYLTDFLVKQFDAFVWRPMGLDKHPELRDMVFGNYTKLVYQSQIDDPALVAKARDCADRMGLAFEHRHTGYGDLQSAMMRWGGGARD